jgi:3-deoxy-D-arabino-heptulosonate 7-phosphate (DAHP) synthase
MIIAGNCLYNNIAESPEIIENATALKEIGVDYFRCKIHGGGTSAIRYYLGIGKEGIPTLEYINDSIMPTGTEIHLPDQAEACRNLQYIWLGARNSRNYSVLEGIKDFPNDIMLKRGMDMTINEVINMFDLCVDKYEFNPYIIDRGIVGIDRQEDSRWSPDLKGVIRIKQERPDIFRRLIIDCSHSVGRKELIADTYYAFKAIGCQHFMFEATIDGKSLTDQRQMLNVKELDKIIN